MRAPVNIMLVVVVVVVIAASWASCASQAVVHRTHLGAVLDLPNTDVALEDVHESGRTDDDRAKAQKLMADGARLRDEGDLQGSQKALE